MFSNSGFLKLFIASFLVTCSSGLILDCKYSIITNWNIPEIYTCIAKVIFVGDTENVTDVTFNHLDGKYNSDVKGILFEDQILKFVPRNIHSFFPNIESYDLSSSEVEQLNSEHLTGFNELKEFRFDDSNLKIIENDLFSENPLLTWISFSGNPVRHVGHNVFDQLKFLQSLSFSGHQDACINESVMDNPNDIDLLLFQLIVNCPATFHMTENKILNGPEFQRLVDTKITERLDPIRDMLLLLQENQRVLDQRVRVLESDGSNESS